MGPPPLNAAVTCLGIKLFTSGLFEQTTYSNICPRRSRERDGFCRSKLSKASFS